jgi:hypothetical protein
MENDLKKLRLLKPSKILPRAEMDTRLQKTGRQMPNWRAFSNQPRAKRACKPIFIIQTITRR